MTEQYYIQSFFSRFWKAWLAAFLVGLLLGWYVSLQLKPSYEGSVSFTIDRIPEQGQNGATFYRYDGYYAEQAAVLARNNFDGWVRSPKTVNDVYSNAGISLGQKSAAALNKIFTVSEAISSNADVIYRTSSKNDGQRLGEALVEYTKQNYQIAHYAITASSPIVLQLEPPRRIIMLAVALSLALATFVTSLVIHYFTPEKQK